MPQPPIPVFWNERIRSHLAHLQQLGEKLSDKRIRRLLEKEAEALGKGANAEQKVLADRVPSERSISRIRKEVWPALTDEEQAVYRVFEWPESMVRGDLPWAASQAALELLYLFGLYDHGVPRVSGLTPGLTMFRPIRLAL